VSAHGGHAARPVGLRIVPRTEARRRSRLRVPPLALRAIAFGALCLFATAHWAAMVSPPPFGRALLVALLAMGAGVAIALTAPLPQRVGTPLRVLIVLALAVLALGAIGVRLRLLWPTGWDTLHDRIAGGLTAAGAVSSWPYAGPNAWLRLTTLLAAPLTATLAAAFAFWPRRGAQRTGLGFPALALLVGLYGVAAAARDFSVDGLRGLGLLAAMAAWLWLPRLRGRDAAAAVTAVVVAGLTALIFTGPVASHEPWVDYRSWTWTLHKEKAIAFDWRHDYGPLEWPRRGTTMLLVKAKQAHYWKAENLERFDGTRWTTVSHSEAPRGEGDVVAPAHKGWNETIDFTVRGLASDVVVGAGTVYEVSSDKIGQTVELSPATYLMEGSLRSGDTYEVRAYVPDPTAAQMRRAPHPDLSMQRYTDITLPGYGSVAVPLRFDPATDFRGSVEQAIRRSPYARMYRLAKRVTAGATTDYEIVKRVNAWLEGHYRYSELVPSHLYPLSSFLFQDRRGYCQQFSGAAALMLRMLGVPARVATGFTPGSLNKETNEYVVRDLDAHSWIEVWFEGIGWVPFDPTPALAPAQSQTGATVAPSAARGDTRDRLPARRLDQLLGPRPESATSGGGSLEEDPGTPWGPIALAASGFLLAAMALAVWLRARRRRHSRPRPLPCGDAEVDRLVRLVGRLGLDVAPGTTLYALEQRLTRLGGPEAAGYARRLRERRFGDAGEPPPGRADRRRLRHALAKGTGAGALVRFRLALPDNPLHRTR
jgi:transglutaminase-like putative cysteine protease